MSLESIESFLDVLRRVQLLSPEQVEEVATELLPCYDDPRNLGEYLVEVDWLTPYQLELLLSEQYDELLIGPYQVLDRLGEGGLSEVFKAWDTSRGRVVALKVLRQHLAVNSDVRRQFQRELQIITRLSHPNTIKTFDAHQDHSIHYFAMEFVEGMDLDRFVEETGPLPIEHACDYIRQVAQGLQHAHQLGLVHRDIKPANLFLLHPPLPAEDPASGRRPDPVVKIIDWGLARCRVEQAGSPAANSGEADEEKGRLLGTADYIAPEQAHDPTLVDIRADIYSMGCTLFYLLAGQPPFQGNSLMQKLLQHQEAPPPSLRAVRPDVPEELETLIHRMLAKNPEDRFPIPLLVVAPLRRFMGRSTGSNNLETPGTAPGTALNLPRPGTSTNLTRPGTSSELSRPSTAAEMARPGTNGTGYPPRR